MRASTSAYRPAISYNSCRDRHCPKCQANARARWLLARRQEFLPTRYVDVVFIVPHELAIYLPLNYRARPIQH
jgi:Transposase zinc-binding domain